MDEDQSNLFWNKSKNPGQIFFIDDDQKRLNQKKIEKKSKKKSKFQKFEFKIFFGLSAERFSFSLLNTYGRRKAGL